MGVTSRPRWARWERRHTGPPVLDPGVGTMWGPEHVDLQGPEPVDLWGPELVDL